VKDFSDDKKEQQVRQFLESHKKTILISQGTGIAVSKEQVRAFTNLANTFP
jgi:hypothetical protein